MPGQAALRVESGCFTRKALSGPRSSAPSTSSSSLLVGAAAYLSSQVRASYANWQDTWHVHLFLLFFTIETSGRARAAALGLKKVLTQGDFCAVP